MGLLAGPSLWAPGSRPWSLHWPLAGDCPPFRPPGSHRAAPHDAWLPCSTRGRGKRGCEPSKPCSLYHGMFRLIPVPRPHSGREDHAGTWVAGGGLRATPERSPSTLSLLTLHGERRPGEVRWPRWFRSPPAGRGQDPPGPVLPQPQISEPPSWRLELPLLEHRSRLKMRCDISSRRRGLAKWKRFHKYANRRVLPCLPAHPSALL